MKPFKPLLAAVFTITVSAGGTSLYIATLENPTDLQKGFSTTANTIAIGGATALFGLLNEDEDDQDNKDG